MNNKSIIKWTNRISLIAIALLIYWVFIFISITVFDFKVFKQNITQSFYLSILGILAVLMGAVIVNVMFNLTSISKSLLNRETAGATATIKSGNKLIFALLLSFPVIFLFLVFGDYRTSKLRENNLIKAAKYSIDDSSQISKQLLNYKFTKKYIQQTAANLKLIAKQAESFPSISIIVKEKINNKQVFLRFTSYYHTTKKSNIKLDYIYSSSPKEKEYLKSVFDGKNNKHLFSAADGNYELYYPYQENNKTIVLYFTDRKRYGKMGSY